jgi:hypothetical protein
MSWELADSRMSITLTIIEQEILKTLREMGFSVSICWSLRRQLLTVPLVVHLRADGVGAVALEVHPAVALFRRIAPPSLRSLANCPPSLRRLHLFSVCVSIFSRSIQSDVHEADMPFALGEKSLLVGQ